MKIVKREIEFRFWNGTEMDYSPETHTGWLNDNFSPDMEDDGTWGYMQFTGFIDDNGKKIYEGDIIQYDNPTYDPSEGDAPYNLSEVRFTEGCWQFEEGALSDHESYRVVGNIYQDKDLLK